jgi:hypothetical protein
MAKSELTSWRLQGWRSELRTRAYALWAPQGIKLRFQIPLLAVLFLLAAMAANGSCERPIITAPTAIPDSTGQQETISWTTNVAADSLVGYGAANAGTLTPVTDAPGTTTHSVTIAGLIPGQTYGFSIRSRAIDDGKPCSDAYYAFYGGAGSTRFTTAPPPSGPFDYKILPFGPHYVTQGFGVYLGIGFATLGGTYPTNSLTLRLTGLPSHTSIRWTDTQVIGDGVDTVSATTIPGDTLKMHDLGGWGSSPSGAKEAYVLTNVNGITPPETYRITMTASGAGQPTHNGTWTLVVEPSSAPFDGVAFPYGVPPSFPPIPNLSTYVHSAEKYGVYQCAQDFNSPRTIRPNTTPWTPVGPGTTYSSWFYDGVSVYNNVQLLVNDGEDWGQCRDNVAQVYRDNYVLPRNGNIQAFMMFSEGYYLDYEQTRNPADLTLVNEFDSHMYPPYHAGMVDVSYLQRETAYDLKNAIYASLLGQDNPRSGNHSTIFWRSYLLDHVLGQVDQICLSQNAQYFESFMTGLQAEALTQYYKLVSPDPRIPPAIKCLADYMYSKAYNSVTSDPGAFPYDKWRMLTDEGYANGGSCMINLNMLIAPMYAWMFQHTGLVQYQREGDEIWNHGVLFDGCGRGPAANLAGNSAGKVFSQQYYWGSSYVTWRSSPRVSSSGVPDQPAPPSGLSATVY